LGDNQWEKRLDSCFLYFKSDCKNNDFYVNRQILQSVFLK
jgi:hypothetical protein